MKKTKETLSHKLFKFKILILIYKIVRVSLYFSQ